MKKALIHYIQNGVNDELYTPPNAIEPILKYLNKDWIYWECTDYGESNITKILKEGGYYIISTNKKDLDFLKDEPNFQYDCIITNPPYSLKDEFLERAYKYNKPFMFLLPITALEGVKRNKLYKENGLEIIVLNKRINYMKEKKSNWFNTSWFCWKVCKNQLNFEEVKESNL